MEALRVVTVIMALSLVNCQLQKTVRPTLISRVIYEGVDCEEGDFFEGPYCHTFYMCATGRTLQRILVLFSCGANTMFDITRSVCVHTRPSICPTAFLAPPLGPDVEVPQPEGPIPPLIPGPGKPVAPIFPIPETPIIPVSPIPEPILPDSIAVIPDPARPQVVPPPSKPDETVPPIVLPFPPPSPSTSEEEGLSLVTVLPAETGDEVSPPGVQPPNEEELAGPPGIANPPADDGSDRPIITLPLLDIDGNNEVSSLSECPRFRLDTNSIVNCTQEGRWEHPASCDRFYQCIHTMDCIIKGFLFRCPENFQFDNRERKCREIFEPSPCRKFADDSGSSNPFIYPVIQLDADSIQDFDAASAYWDFMSFLPNEEQRILSAAEASSLKNL